MTQKPNKNNDINNENNDNSIRFLGIAQEGLPIYKITRNYLSLYVHRWYKDISQKKTGEPKTNIKNIQPDKKGRRKAEGIEL